MINIVVICCLEPDKLKTLPIAPLVFNGKSVILLLVSFLFGVGINSVLAQDSTIPKYAVSVSSIQKSSASNSTPATNLINKRVIALKSSVLANVAATAPNISYQTPQTYSVNQSIAPLMPANTGGAVPQGAYGQVTTFAGNTRQGNADGNGTAASFYGPVGVILDSGGNLFVADANSNQIRKITPGGQVTTFAGNGTAGNSNGTGRAATFNNPAQLAIDASDNLYVADWGNNLIREITPAGVVTTYAGNGQAGTANGPKNQASFSSPAGIVFDSAGNMFVADANNSLIRKITPAGIVSTFAGGAYSPVLVNGNGANSTFLGPMYLAIDQNNNLYVADSGSQVVRKITPNADVTTYAGNGQPGSSNGNGQALSASFDLLFSVAVDAAGNVYAGDENCIRIITPTGAISTFAGNLTAIGSANGARQNSSFYIVGGLTLDNGGHMFIGDKGNNEIREIGLSGYTIDKSLPAGLNFDPNTGIISGKPTVSSPATNYTVTAYNEFGSSSTVVNIQVTDNALLPSVITFPTVQVNPDGNNNVIPGATSTNNETPIVYTSSNPSVATITPDGLIHLVGPGVTVITATQAGNADYNPATPTTEILTVMENQVIHFPALSPVSVCGADFPAGAVSSNPTLPLTYSSSNPLVATISSAGIIHVVGAGTTTITAYQNGNNLYVTANPVSQVLTVTAPAPPVVTITANNNTVCAGMPITFTATVTNGGNNILYQWQLNGINVLGNSPVISFHTVAATDVIQCVVTIEGPCPASAISNSLTNVVGIPYVTPTVSIQSSAATASVCAGTAVTFTATATGAGTNPLYQWQVNGVNAGTNNSTFISNVLNNGDVVTCTLTNTTSPCLTITTVTSNKIVLTVNPVSTLVPAVTISPDYYSSCQGISVTYTATATNAGNNPAYQWQVNGQNAGINASTFSSSSLNTGDLITCIVTTSVACSIATATSNTAGIKSDPEIINAVTITSSAAANGNIISPNEVVTFTAKAAYTTAGTTITDYQWQVNGINAGTDNATFSTSNLVNGDLVTCMLTTTGACIAVPFVYSNTIKVIVVTPVVIKNTFTPNGDGINDTWNIPALAAYPTCTVSIFTRYGTLVYNSNGYPKPWDGTYHNSNLPTGTYYYIIDLKNGKKPLSGYIALLR